MPLIFSYGTLQRENVQLATFGRKLGGHADELPRYETSAVRIEDPKVAEAAGQAFHANVLFNGRDDSTVMGTALEVTDAELEMADRYEKPASYKRIGVTLASGKEAWVYHYAAPVPAEDASDLGVEPVGPIDFLEEFKKTQRRTWRKSRLWAGLAAIGFVGLLIGEDRWEESTNAILFALGFAGTAGIILVVRKHYRCPACGEGVWKDGDGIDLLPKECPHCGVRIG